MTDLLGKFTLDLEPGEDGEPKQEVVKRFAGWLEEMVTKAKSKPSRPIKEGDEKNTYNLADLKQDCENIIVAQNLQPPILNVTVFELAKMTINQLRIKMQEAQVALSNYKEDYDKLKKMFYEMQTDLDGSKLALDISKTEIGRLREQNIQLDNEISRLDAEIMKIPEAQLKYEAENQTLWRVIDRLLQQNTR